MRFRACRAAGAYISSQQRSSQPQLELKYLLCTAQGILLTRRRNPPPRKRLECVYWFS
jgi:hypothetical protein